ncbi:RIP metalloprotease RseP [Candidatus Liberibacter brunswickensis]|uniref:RIP metalloprotease RseP n=1 Tax=Candidatus Liberibacter brunswickensis TaxID=1968796 RepID=UPI002FDF4B1C
MFGLDYFLLYIISFSIIVVMHEFGHYLAARLCNVRVLSFSVGFGPEIFGINSSSGVRWKISPIPLGGYVAFSEDDNDRRSFVRAPPWKKIIIVLAGPFINYVMAILFFSFFFYKMVIIEPIVFNVSPDSPAAISGIKSGDRILSINGRVVSSFEDISSYISSRNSLREMDIVLRRENVGMLNVKVTPHIKVFIDKFGVSHKIPSIGIFFSSDKGFRNRTVLQSLLKGLNEVISVTRKAFSLLVNIFSGDMRSNQISGPVGIAKIAKNFADNGFTSYIRFLAIFSWATGFMNLFPIPILDGGNLIIFLLEMIRGKPLKDSTSRAITRIGMFMILFLFFLGIRNDIYDLMNW